MYPYRLLSYNMDKPQKKIYTHSLFYLNTQNVSKIFTSKPWPQATENKEDKRNASRPGLVRFSRANPRAKGPIWIHGGTAKF